MGDVAQWSIYEITSADESSYYGKIGIGDISMADMQRANSSAIDPSGGESINWIIISYEVWDFSTWGCKCC